MSAARKIWGFHGGVHPPENKHQSMQVPLRPAGIPPQLIVPLSQHLGAPAEPIVEVGQQVLKGQMIAEADGFISVPVHAPSSGVVLAIEDRAVPHSSGLTAPCVIIDCDGKDEWIEHHGIEDYTAMDKQALLQLIRNSGIAGMGGAGFPASVKLNVSPETPIETLIINGTECEPYITADDILMRERAQEIIQGACILRHLVNPAETVIGVEDNKPEGIAALQAAAEGTGIEIAVLPTKYPSGGEKQLIELLTGKQVPSGGLPSSVGIVCQNIGSTVAIYRAVVHGEPLISRITTLTGEAIQQPGNLEVLLGSPIEWLLEQVGYQAEQNNRLIMGGPMMGFSVTDLGAPVIKTTNCLLAPTESELPTPPPAQACIRCGMCAEACPASLLPQQLYWFAQGKEHEKLEAHNLFDCIECGACSYVCPSNIPLVQYYRASKAEIQQMRRDHAKSEHSRTRFEARQERIEREALAKEEQRKARKAAAEARAKAAAAGESEQDVIQAAIERAKNKKQQSADPAQAAIEKAKAARAAAADMSPEEKARSGLQKLLQRKQKSEEKLAQSREDGAADNVIEALEAGLAKLAEKIEAAEAEVAQYGPAEAAPAPEPTTDPAQAAIEKAKAARAAAANMSPEEKARNNLKKLLERKAKSEQKLAEGREDGTQEKVIEALEATIEKLAEKIETARAELAQFETSAEPAEVAVDPAQAAIDRAKAKRAAAAAAPPLSQREQLEQNQAAVEKRLQTAQDKLAEAEAEGSDKVEALRMSIDKLTTKLEQVRTDLAALED